MSEAVTLGPISLPIGLVVLFAALFLGSWAGRRAGRPVQVDPEGMLYAVFLAGLLAARLAFVAQYSAAYLQSPLAIVDVRDGGWSPAFGLLAAALATGWFAWRRPAQRKPLLVAAGTAGVLWLAGTLLPAALRADAPRLPALTLSDLAGRQVPLAGFTGRPTVVNLWATWCPPCRREMPVLQQAQAARPDLHFVFLNQGESAAKVQGWLAGQQLPLRNVLLDAQGQAGLQLGHRALPTTLFFDARGRLVDTRVGELSHATLAQRLQALAPSSATPSSSTP